jgi:glycosyltransferase involved in cell wall biosynthesis
MKISVITAVWNNCETVAQALDSVLSQTHTDVEMIVIDGASTDGTREVLERYRDRLAVLVSERDAGIYDALNKGIALANGDVIGFLHADDLLADSTVLARIASAFTRDIDGVYGDLLYVRKQNPSQTVRYWRSRPFTPDLCGKGWMPAHPTLYLRRAVYHQHGQFDTSYRIAADYDFMLRILMAGTKVVYLPAVLVKMRVGGISNRSLGNLLRKSREDLRALQQNRVGGIWALLRKNLSKLPQFFVTAART